MPRINYWFQISWVLVPLLFLAASKQPDTAVVLPQTYPPDYFQPPVRGMVRLSGTFGELRHNHFHTGLDIKPVRLGVAGDDILAAAEGYISRVIVSAKGYGNALFITHPNGYTTVYGHLEVFAPQVAAFVKAQQYETKSFEQDLRNLPFGQFPVQQGAVIGLMGNSGSSLGPHLHFEIRETKTDHALNPLLFGIPITDDVPPTLYEIGVYELNHLQETIDYQKFVPVPSEGTAASYRLAADTVMVSNSRIGVGVRVFDQATGVPNLNGIFALKILVGDSVVYHFEATKLAFAERRYLNAHIDYRKRQQYQQFAHRCYLLPNNLNTTIYKKVKERGIISVSTRYAQKITISTSDFLGNTTQLVFWVKQNTANKLPNLLPFNYILPYEENNAVVQSNLKLFFPKGSLYERLYLRTLYTAEMLPEALSGVYHIQDFSTPVHAEYQLYIRPSKPIADTLRTKVAVVNCASAEHFSYPTTWDGDFVRATPIELGDFCVMLDTVAPQIATTTTAAGFMFEVDDNLSRTIHYEGFVDGQWVLGSFDEKSKTLTYLWDEHVSFGRHEFRLSVKDEVGNQRVFAAPFLR